MDNLPRYVDLVTPLVQVLEEAGKPLSNSEIESAIIDKLQISNTLANLIHSGQRTELQYRLAWARTKAKSLGKIYSPKRETWTIKNI